MSSAQQGLGHETDTSVSLPFGSPAGSKEPAGMGTMGFEGSTCLEAEAIDVLGGDDHPAFAFEHGLAALAELERGVALNAQIQRGGDLFAGEQLLGKGD